MMFCERARPAGIDVISARSIRQGTFAKLKAPSRTKSKGMPDIRRLVGRIHVQNVLNGQISSFLYVIRAKKLDKS